MQALAGAPAKPRGRPGRPRIPDAPIPLDDQVAVWDQIILLGDHAMWMLTPNQLRRARQRLAQRAYRSRKRAVDQSSHAQNAHRGSFSLDEKASFPQPLSGKSLRNMASPKDMALLLKTTPVELLTFARQEHSLNQPWSNLGQERTSMDGKKPIVSVLADFSDALSRFPDFSPVSGATSVPSKLPKDVQDVQIEGVDVTSLGYRIVRECFRRGIAALSIDMLPGGMNPTPLLLPLRIGDTEFLVGLSVAQMKDLSDGYWGDARYDKRTLNAMPRMFRIVEGYRDGAVPRKAPPELQILQYGRTRTILQTTLPNLQHEFLEASDVEEYLEERGILVRGTEDIVELGLEPEGGYQDDGHELADWTIFGQQSSTSHTIPSGLSTFMPSSEQSAMLAESSQLLPECNPDHGGTLGSSVKITISLDKLVESLVANASCLGPAPGITKAHVDLAISSSIVATTN